MWIYGELELEVFVYGPEAPNPDGGYLTTCAARSTKKASLAVVRLHELREGTARMTQQNPLAIDNGVPHVYYVDLQQSMRNGGGPACLRLRVVPYGSGTRSRTRECDVDGIAVRALGRLVSRHYRDRLHVNDCVDPLFLKECQKVLDEFTKILSLGLLYDLQP